jgi:predicted PurR-regulated permease PerM
MEHNKKRYLVIILSLLSLVIVLSILTLVIQNSKKTTNQTPSNPTPTYPPLPTTYQQSQTRLTPIPTSITPIIDQSITPNLTPIEFTGVKEEPIPQEMVDFSKQKLSLMQKLPLKTTDFAIDFDYDNDKFVVTLNPPKEESQKKFEDWLKNSYPSIPKDLFIFQ